MKLLIVSTLPEEDPEAQQVIGTLRGKAEECRVITVRDIRPCAGCNACWLVTPGICAIHDGYEEILKAYLQADATVFVCGTALGFAEYRMKNVIDRILPLLTMLLAVEDGQMRHVARYKKRLRWGMVYAGEADEDYMNRWMKRVTDNARGECLGAFPASRAQEVPV